MEKMTKQDGKSLDMVNENLVALKAIFSEAFTEDGVDFEVLRELLGDAVAEGEEKYGFTWHGKKKARQIALTPSMGTLLPCKEESVDWDTTQNLFIEGDNLEVLKLLQKSYANKVKMIYIDPPYNTGNDFIYPDRFQDNLDTYLMYTGQKDDEGFKFSSNTESSGRYHTNWLNMMYPRLKLARNLLNNDGVIFISIDDNELSNLRRICDEIFGEENFVGNIAWKKTSGDNKPVFAFTHDNILIFTKSTDCFPRVPLNKEQRKQYKNPDNDSRGEWAESDYRCKWSKNERPNLYYEITNPITGEKIFPDTYSDSLRVWGCEPKTHIKNTKDNQVWWGIDGTSREPKKKRFLKDHKGANTRSVWVDAGTNDQAGKEVRELLEGDYFDNPKPVSLLKRITNILCQNNDIILDFFAGSSTTGHAVLDLNKENGGNRKFIMVQLPEPCDEKSEAFKAGYKTIADIGKQRIRRAAAKIQKENPKYDGDLGFKVFKLDSSNIRAWSPDRNDLEQTLIDHMEHLIEGRSEEDVLYELLLKRGVDLTVPIEEKIITGKTVYSIGYGVLFACLDTPISREEVEALAQGIIEWHKELEPTGDTQVVFRDSAFANDISKTNMTAILEQHGIAHVRSL